MKRETGGGMAGDGGWRRGVSIRMRARWSGSAIALVVLRAAVSTTAVSAQTVEEFLLPAGSDSNRITAGGDGNLWFTEPSGKIGRITTAGDVTEFPLPSSGNLQGIAAGPDGNLWFADAFGKIGRITTAGTIDEFVLPRQATPTDIVAGPDGNLWFTEYYADAIGRITPAGVVTHFRIPSDNDPWPTRIAVGGDGNLWFAESASFIGRITPTGVITRFAIPSGASAVGLAAGADGALWFTQRSRGAIGRLTAAGVFSEFPIPSGSGQSITSGSDGELWFTELEDTTIGRITTDGDVALFVLPFHSRPIDIAAGPDGNLWVAESPGDRIGRITPLTAIPPGPCLADATTLCLDGGRFRVQAEWRAPSLETNGHGRAVSLTGNTGAFWFFDPTNIEVVVKVLNGCSINGRRWVFAGGLTNVGVTLTVADMQRGVVEMYRNPAGVPFQPIQHTSAFSTCP